MGQGGLPCAVDGTVAFVCNDDIKIAARKLRVAADHGLEQADRDLLLLPDHAWPKPIAAVLIQDVLNGFKGLFGKLFPVRPERGCARRVRPQ